MWNLPWPEIKPTSSALAGVSPLAHQGGPIAAFSVQDKEVILQRIQGVCACRHQFSSVEFSLCLVWLFVTPGAPLQHARLPCIARSNSLTDFLFFFYNDPYAGFVYLETAATTAADLNLLYVSQNSTSSRNVIHFSLLLGSASSVTSGTWYGVIEGSRCCSKVRENRRGHLLTASISLRERQTAHLEWQASQGICKWILRAPELSVVSIGGDVAVGTATQRAPRFIPAGAVPHRAVTSVYIPPHCQWLHVCSVCVLQLW